MKEIEKQAIEEMAQVIEITEQIARDAHCGLPSPTMYAKDLYWKGYRKQIKAEWKSGRKNGQFGYYCTNCDACFTGENAEWIAKEHDYCPKCGAHMKCGAE